MSENKHWFMFAGEELILQSGPGGSFTVPCSPKPPFSPTGMLHDLGKLNEVSCMACMAKDFHQDNSAKLFHLRASFDVLERPLYDLAGLGWQRIYWETHTRYCSICGTKTMPSTFISKKCPSCGYEMFPHISTAIIVLICRGDSILMVRAHNFTGPFYGLVAGFIEPGEALGECVLREVKEEVNLEVENLRYFGSQPWPYPSGLMVGFIADYKSGELKIQEEELSEAAFFPRTALPPLPHKLSLARSMVDWWLSGRELPEV